MNINQEPEGALSPPSPFMFRWTRLIASNPGPCARSSHGVSLVVGGVSGGPRLIVMGGENVARIPLDSTESCWGLDLHRLEWYRIDSSVVPSRLAHAQATVGSTTSPAVYMFGGRSGITMNEKAMNDVWKLDCSGPAGQERWCPMVVPVGDPPAGSPSILPEPRSFHRMVAVQDRLYVFGGCGASGRLADFHSFDTSLGVFGRLPSSDLRGRGGPNLILLAGGTKIGVVAGFAGEETSDGQVYDIDSGAWEDSVRFSSRNLSGLRPRSVCVSASFPSAGISVVFGGEVNPSDRGHEGAGKFANDLVVLRESDGSLLMTVAAPSPPPHSPTEGEEDSSWPCPRGWADAASIDHGDGTGSMYLFGGLTGGDANPKRLDDLWRLDISRSTDQP